jgi:hypothetical protein
METVIEYGLEPAQLCREAIEGVYARDASEGVLQGGVLRDQPRRAAPRCESRTPRLWLAPFEAPLLRGFSSGATAAASGRPSREWPHPRGRPTRRTAVDPPRAPRRRAAVSRAPQRRRGSERARSR